jgi:WhiB family transcriptional regulator, redox-sensing transcriptional regulator
MPATTPAGATMYLLADGDGSDSFSLLARRVMERYITDVVRGEARWMDDGTCVRSTTKDAWYPDRPTPARAAAQCHKCPVIQQCLDWAIKHGETEGIWGGMNPEDREQVAAERLIAGHDR